ncbi:MAG TPA: hypothetical protein VKA63_03385 [Candidatus Krumholzibacteria bacterium]|nr:hypothetical protein [Candidatus Krumholzibacteria bacterium]
MRFGSLARAIVAALVVSSIASVARATTVFFDDFDTGDTYDSTTGVFVHWINDYQSLGLGTSDQDVAMPFTVSGTGYDSYKFELGLTLDYGDNEIDISVANDNAGEPGTVLQTWHVSGALPSYPGAGAPITVYATSLTLTDGAQYWVFVSASGPNDSQVVWNRNTVGYTGLTAGWHEFWGNPGFWVTNTYGAATMRVTGQTRAVAASTNSWGAVKALFH